MGVFTNMLVREDYGYAEDVLKNVKIHQFDESASLIECAITSLSEAEQDWNNIITGMVMKEYAVLEATGQEMVYEAVDIKGFFNKVVEWFKKLWAKISGLFSKLLGWVQSKVSSDKAFLKKYGDKLKNANIKSEGFSFKGHKYENINKIDYTDILTSVESEGKEYGISVLSAKVSFSDNTGDERIKDIKDNIEDFRKNKDSVLDTIRGKALNKSEKIGAKDFARKAKEYLNGEEFTTYKTDVMSVNEIYNEIKDGKFTKENAKIQYTQLKNTINVTIAKVNNYKNNVIKINEPKYSTVLMAMANCSIDLLKSTASIYQQLNGIHLSCLAARHNQAKSLAVKIVAASDKAENESAFYYGGSYVEESETSDLEAMFEI